MGDDQGESEIRETIVDVRKLKEVLEDEDQRQVVLDLDHGIIWRKERELLDFGQFKAVEGFERRYVDIMMPYFEDLDEHSSGQLQVAPSNGGGGGAGSGGGSGFYRVPPDMRRRAGIENLYDSKYINFWKINDLFEKDDDDPGDVQTRSHELRHYCYHLHSFANREGENIESLMLELYKKREEIEKSGYDHAEQQKPLSTTFPYMLALLLGSSFLHDLFYRSLKNEFSPRDDPECAHLWVSELWVDLLLLENQIPGFIHPRYYHLLYLYFSDFLPQLNSETVSQVLLREEDHGTRPCYHRHILHFIHDMLLPSKRDHEGGSVFIASTLARLCCPNLTAKKGLQAPWTMKPVPTATRLQQAGVKFRAVDRGKGFMVEFERGVLKLPRLHVSKTTKKVLLNLIAWEKCHNEEPKYFINYAIFMDYLINSYKDVEILVQSRVFEHSLATDEEVVALFSDLCEGLVYTKEDGDSDVNFPTLSMELNKYVQRNPNAWWANLVQDYFKIRNWAIISLAGTLILNMFTMTQTFFTVYSYFQPPK